MASAIDEGLYSRQLAVLGHAAMERMAKANVLIVNVGGLGVEIAKNVILAGVKSVTIHDDASVALRDLGTQFYLRKEDVGKNRAQVVQPRLAELNPYVPVQIATGPLTEAATFAPFEVVVLTDVPLSLQKQINGFTHNSGIKCIIAETRGLFAHIFVDLCKGFQIMDPTGEEALHGMIANITMDDGVATVHCHEDQRHGLEDGDFVTFSEIKGLTSLNGAPACKIKTSGPFAFSIGKLDAKAEDADFIQGSGLWHQAKQPKTQDFPSLADSLANPEFFVTDFAKFDRPAQLHLGFQALHQFEEQHKRSPNARSEADAAAFLQLVDGLQKGDKITIDDWLKELAYQAKGNLAPMNAVIGGTVAQEVLKAVSGKFHPIVGECYFDALECLPKEKPTEQDCQDVGSRYDSQICVFGQRFHDTIANQRQFLVGAGAIGCEMLKNWALMGLGTGKEGHVTVTDMDTIEKSNLNRQFLFRNADVGKTKSETAAKAVTQMNPDLHGHITVMQDRVGADTEHIFNDAFFSALTGVTNALDNVDARLYMDQRCIFYRKPLLESGTLGTKGNAQVIVPDLTESYGSSRDPPEKALPMCTVKHFPNQIEHTIQWALDHFKSTFTAVPESANLYLSNPKFVEDTLKQGGNAKDIIEQVKEALTTDKPTTFDQCIHWARLLFERLFNHDIKQLLYNFPADSVTSSGQPFWSGPKRVPHPIVFDASSPVQLGFIIAAANLHAFNYGLQGDRNPDKFASVLKTVKVPAFEPKTSMKIATNDAEAQQMQQQQQNGLSDLDTVIASLPKMSPGYRLNPAEFGKDDDSNFHIDYMTAASNLRAMIYEIPVADRLKTKFIAGKIIPAIATTTSLITGLVNLELYKLMDRQHKTIEEFKNGFVNLALPFFGFSEPVAAPKAKYNDTEWTLWDRFEITGNPTLREFIDWFATQHNLELSALSSGVTMLYGSFFPAKKMADRMNLKMTELIEMISKKPLPKDTKHVVLDVCVNDKEGEDVDVPYVVLKID